LIEARVMGMLAEADTKARQIGPDRFMPEIFQVLGDGGSRVSEVEASRTDECSRFGHTIEF